MALSLYGSWARAEKALRALEMLFGGGGFSENFARDALGASRRAGVPLIAALLTLLHHAATYIDETDTTTVRR